MTLEAAKEKNLGYRLLVKPTQVNDTSAGGIILTPNIVELDRQQAKNNIGVVLEVGEHAYKHGRYGFHGQEDFEQPYKRGDLIRFKEYAGVLFKYPGETGELSGDYYQILNDDDVLSITEGNYE